LDTDKQTDKPTLYIDNTIAWENIHYSRRKYKKSIKTGENIKKIYSRGKYLKTHYSMGKYKNIIAGENMKNYRRGKYFLKIITTREKIKKIII